MKQLDVKALMVKILKAQHPVGSYLFTSDYWFDPNEDIGGTWELLDEGYVLLSGSRSGTYRAGREYGENTHTLTEQEMPAHEHEVKWEHSFLVSLNQGSFGYGYALKWDTPEGNGRLYGASTGGGQPHNIMQKSKAVYIWHRTA